MVCVWDARSGRLLRTTKLPGGATLHAGGDGGHAAAHTQDGLWVWDIHLAELADAARAMRVSPYVFVGDGIVPQRLDAPFFRAAAAAAR